MCESSITSSIVGSEETESEAVLRYIFINRLKYDFYRETDDKMFEMIKNPDLLELIFRYLDPASVKAASKVSR